MHTVFPPLTQCYILGFFFTFCSCSLWCRVSGAVFMTAGVLLAVGVVYLTKGTPFLSRPSCWRSQRLSASLPQFSSQRHSAYVEQSSLALQVCCNGTACCSHVSRAVVAIGVAGVVGVELGGVFRHFSWPRFSISTALVFVWQQEEQSAAAVAAGGQVGSSSQSLDDQPLLNGFNTWRHRSASVTVSTVSVGEGMSQSSSSSSISSS